MSRKTVRLNAMYCQIRFTIHNQLLVLSTALCLMVNVVQQLQSFYGAFEQIKEATGNDALEVFETAMENIMPVLEVRARRVGGSNYQVPVEVRPERRTTLGLRWLVTIARQRGEHTMVDRLAKEILDAANNTGAAVKKREDTHRMAEANRAFAHFRW